MSSLPRLDTPSTLAGVTIETLLDGVKHAAIQAEILAIKHPESDVIDQVRLTLAKVYETVDYEERVWKRSGESDEQG